jgi:hypothetical protein
MGPEVAGGRWPVCLGLGVAGCREPGQWGLVKIRACERSHRALSDVFNGRCRAAFSLRCSYWNLKLLQYHRE